MLTLYHRTRSKGPKKANDSMLTIGKNIPQREGIVLGFSAIKGVSIKSARGLVIKKSDWANLECPYINPALKGRNFSVDPDNRAIK